MENTKLELTARLVLDDCRWAISQYFDDLSGEQLRTAWVSITVLLRAVGHVLKKVDSAKDPIVANVVNQEWTKVSVSKPKPEILWEFIEHERNNVIKEYEFGFKRTFVASKPIPTGQAGIVILADLLSVKGGPLPPQPLPELKSLILSGPFKGRSEKEVAIEAVGWWDAYISTIEREVSQIKSKP